MKKYFTYSSTKQLWRILISDSNKLILETRDISTKEVFYNCYDLDNLKEAFCDFQLDEKIWIGIEAVYRDVIYFHKYPKPDMPLHKEIIAFDIKTQKVLWTNASITFLFAHNNLIYTFTQGFEEREFYALDYLSGEVKEILGNDYQKINSLRNESDNPSNWSSYRYPEKLNRDIDLNINSLINSKIGKHQLTGKIEFIVHNDFLFLSFNEIAGDNLFTNNFLALNLLNGKEVLKVILNDRKENLFNDSFFIYKNFLFLLKEKSGLIIYEIDK